MPGLILHTSNQLEILAEQLCEVVSSPLESPFTPEIVVVQSLASRRWLTLKIAELEQICANFDFPFIGDFVSRIVKEASAPTELANRMSPELLTWKLDLLLSQTLSFEESSSLINYLRDGDAMKRFHLASRLAHLFDQYRVYRPEMLTTWNRPEETRYEDERWQAKLWQQLGEAQPSFEQAFEQLRIHGFKKRSQLGLAERVSIFAPTSLPPAYLDLLFHLSKIREVHLLLLRPSRVFRGDDLTRKQRARLGIPASAAALANPLITSWGKVDADLTGLLLDKEEHLGVGIQTGSERFTEFETVSLLGTIKSDILDARNRGGGSDADYDPQPAVKIGSDDRSIEVHACYSPMREVEVLYDQLLNCLEKIPGLRPRDILVMTPAIETYAPLIEAVFGYTEDKALHIPYSLADRHARCDSIPIDTFLTLLDLPESRYTASQIFALLGSRSLRRRFKFSDEDLSLIRDWIEDTAIRWGIEGEDRKRFELPALESNTWRHGLKRLLLGYAMEGTGKDLFENILAHAEVEGDGAEVLGRLITVTEGLFGLGETLLRPRPLGEWVKPLAAVVDQFLEPSNEEELRDIFFLRMCIDQLETLGDAMAERPTVEFRIVRRFLAERLAMTEQRGNFFTGGITFCALKPVRSIPARVVCLLGMNDRVFPRRPQALEFDLMAQSPRPGDPSARNDDRYAFLEALLSAKEKLYVSYVGRSAIHKKQIVPSVVVTELMDYLNQAFVFPAHKSAEEFVLREHPLQAFSAKYFSPNDGSELFSYSEANAEASRLITANGRRDVPAFITNPLPPLDDRGRNLELRELQEFWAHPSKYLLRHRLGVTLQTREEGLQDDEPLQLEPLDRYPIKQELLEEELTRKEPLPYAVYQARGVLPPGTAGDLELTSMRIEVGRLARIVQQHNASGPADEPKEIDLVLDEFRISGKINSIYQGQGVYFRTSKLNAKDYLRAWIEHLVMCADDPTPPRTTVLIGKDAVVIFRQVDTAKSELHTLCQQYWQGLTLPLPFFPTSALAFAQAEVNGGGNPGAKARERWYGPFHSREKRSGEKDDPYISLCFDISTALDEPFQRLARLIFVPLFKHSKREEIDR